MHTKPSFGNNLSFKSPGFFKSAPGQAGPPDSLWEWEQWWVLLRGWCPEGTAGCRIISRESRFWISFSLLLSPRCELALLFSPGGLFSSFSVPSRKPAGHTRGNSRTCNCPISLDCLTQEEKRLECALDFLLLTFS